MRKTAQILSSAALLLLVVAPLLFYAGTITLDTNKILMNTATVLWFISALAWMGKAEKAET